MMLQALSDVNMRNISYLCYQIGFRIQLKPIKKMLGTYVALGLAIYESYVILALRYSGT